MINIIMLGIIRKYIIIVTKETKCFRSENRYIPINSVVLFIMFIRTINKYNKFILNEDNCRVNESACDVGPISYINY